MKGFVVSIACISILLLLLELFLSEGETKKYIRGILSLVLVVAILSPLSSLLKKDISFDLTSQQTITDDSYALSLLDMKLNEKSEKIEIALGRAGISNADVTVSGMLRDNKEEITNVSVNLDKAVISQTITNIDIIDLTVATVQSCVNVDKERIVIYGKVYE